MKVTWNSKNQKAQGFTLIEVAIATMVLVSACLIILMLLPTALKAQKASRYKILASLHAQSVVEGFINHDYTLYGNKHRFGQGTQRSFNTSTGAGDTVKRYEEITDELRTMPLMQARFNLENIAANIANGSYPLPDKIASRLQSENDEIRQMVQAGQPLYYLDPLMMGRFDFKARQVGGFDVQRGDTQKIIWGVVGRPQQNMLPFNPVANPIHKVYPFPPQYIFGHLDRTYKGSIGREKYISSTYVNGNGDTVARISTRISKNDFGYIDSQTSSHKYMEAGWETNDGDFTTGFQRNAWETLAERAYKDPTDHGDNWFKPWVNGLEAFRDIGSRSWRAIFQPLLPVQGSGSTVTGTFNTRDETFTVQRTVTQIRMEGGEVVRGPGGIPETYTTTITETRSRKVIDGGPNDGAILPPGFSVGRGDTLPLKGWPVAANGTPYSHLEGSSFFDESGDGHWFSMLDQLRFSLPSLQARYLYRNSALALWAAVALETPTQDVPNIRGFPDRGTVYVSPGSLTKLDGTVVNLQLDTDGDGVVDGTTMTVPTGRHTLPALCNPLITDWANLCFVNNNSGTLTVGSNISANPDKLHPTQVFALSHVAHAAMMVTGYKEPFLYTKNKLEAHESQNALPDIENPLYGARQHELPHKAQEATFMHSGDGDYQNPDLLTASNSVVANADLLDFSQAQSSGASVTPSRSRVEVRVLLSAYDTNGDGTLDVGADLDGDLTPDRYAYLPVVTDPTDANHGRVLFGLLDVAGVPVDTGATMGTTAGDMLDDTTWLVITGTSTTPALSMLHPMYFGQGYTLGNQDIPQIRSLTPVIGRPTPSADLEEFITNSATAVPDGSPEDSYEVLMADQVNPLVFTGTRFAWNPYRLDLMMKAELGSHDMDTGGINAPDTTRGEAYRRFNPFEDFITGDESDRSDDTQPEFLHERATAGNEWVDDNVDPVLIIDPGNTIDPFNGLSASATTSDPMWRRQFQLWAHSGQPITYQRSFGPVLNHFNPPYADTGAYDLAGNPLYLANAEWHLAVDWFNESGANVTLDLRDPLDIASRIRPVYHLVKLLRYSGEPQTGANGLPTMNYDASYHGVDSTIARIAHENSLNAAIVYASHNPYDSLVPKPLNRPTMIDRGLYEYYIFNGTDAVRPEDLSSTETLVHHYPINAGTSATNRFVANHYRWLNGIRSPYGFDDAWKVNSDRGPLVRNTDTLDITPRDWLTDNAGGFTHPRHPINNESTHPHYKADTSFTGHIYHPTDNPFPVNHPLATGWGFDWGRPSYDMGPQIRYKRDDDWKEKAALTAGGTQWGQSNARGNHFSGTINYASPKHATYRTQWLMGHAMDGTIDDIYNVSLRAKHDTEFTLTKSFEANERARQLVYWTVDWQRYQDFEEVPGAPIEYNTAPIGVQSTNMAIRDARDWNPSLSGGGNDPLDLDTDGDGNNDLYALVVEAPNWNNFPNFDELIGSVAEIAISQTISPAELATIRAQFVGWTGSTLLARRYFYFEATGPINPSTTAPYLAYEWLAETGQNNPKGTVRFISTGDESGIGVMGLQNASEANIAWVDPERTATLANFSLDRVNERTVLYWAEGNVTRFRQDFASIYYPRGPLDFAGSPTSVGHYTLPLNTVDTNFDDKDIFGTRTYEIYDTDLSWIPTTYCASFGADRNGNGEFDRGTIDPSVQMVAETVGRFNFYDPRVFINLRQ